MDDIRSLPEKLDPLLARSLDEISYDELAEYFRAAASCDIVLDVLVNGMMVAERSLLLFLESCACDFGGRLDPRKMNEEDRENLERWKASGFVEHGRIVVEHHNKQGSMWVQLSPEAERLAFIERSARGARMWERKRYATTEEARQA